MIRDVAAIFSEVLGPGAVVADEAGMAGYLTDWSGDHRGMAAVVLRPGTVEEVSRVVHLCREHGLAIVPQGGNTGLVQGGVPGS